jgi:hypothetical protein
VRGPAYLGGATGFVDIAHATKGSDEPMAVQHRILCLASSRSCQEQNASHGLFGFRTSIRMWLIQLPRNVIVGLGFLLMREHFEKLRLAQPRSRQRLGFQYWKVFGPGRRWRYME